MAKQIGIDLGTSSTMICSKEKGIIMRSPSVVCIERGTHDVIASGVSAKRMIGKTPSNIRALRPLKDGVITDLEVTSLMLRDFFTRLDMTSMFNRPSALVCIPHGVTEVERRAVEDATFEAGAKNVGLIEEPIAAAVGAGIKVSKARGAMIIDLGGGVSETAVLSLGGVVQSNSVRIAGDELDIAIISYLKQHRNVLIGEITAERLKKALGTAIPGIDRGTMEVCGRDLRTGLAKTVEVTTEEVYRALREPLSEILTMVKSTLEETPPELAADIFDFGIVMVGGGSLLPGIDRAVQERTGIRVTVPKAPADCVCLGLHQMLKSANGDFSEFVRYKVK
ncbi:MAG: rod shape-determining protein [Clostridia bacterium]|nr:rod shape-determining protein [Clostridia bacterium]MBR2926833.1 rod shape-determining protein [Clostridia bacterium]